MAQNCDDAGLLTSLPPVFIAAQLKMQQRQRQYVQERVAFESARERHKDAAKRVDEAEFAALGGPRASRAAAGAAGRETARRQQRVRQAAKQEQQWKRAHDARTQQLLEGARSAINARAAAPPRKVRPTAKQARTSDDASRRAAGPSMDGEALAREHELLIRRRYQALQLQQEAAMSSTEQKYVRAWGIYNEVKQADLVEQHQVKEVQSSDSGGPLLECAVQRTLASSS